MLLLERDLSEPDRIVGELLQPGGVGALKKMGMEDVLEGIDATPVEGYCVVSGDRQVGIPYPALEAMVRDPNAQRTGDADSGKSTTEKEHAGEGSSAARWHVTSASGKKEGRSFHHGRLISSLRKKCLEQAPGLNVLEGTVRDLVYCEHTDRVIGITAAFKVPKSKPEDRPEASRSSSTEDIISVESKDSGVEMETVVKKIYAPLTIIADGCFSKFRSTKGAKLPTPKTRSHFVGVIVRDTDLPLPRHGTVCLTPAGPVLLYQIADKARETRMLVDVKGKLPSVADGSLKVSRMILP